MNFVYSLILNSLFIYQNVSLLLLFINKQTIILNHISLSEK